MSALQKERRLAPDLNLIYDLSEKTNRTNLKAEKDRAVVASLKADLVLPSDKIMTVEIDFDSDSSYHNNAVMVMNSFGAELIATAFESKYGKDAAEKVRAAWQQKEQDTDPRKPTYLMVQAPEDNNEKGKIIASCGREDHPPKKGKSIEI